MFPMYAHIHTLYVKVSSEQNTFHAVYNLEETRFASANHEKCVLRSKNGFVLESESCFETNISHQTKKCISGLNSGTESA